MTGRKYLTEFGLVVTVCARLFGRQREIRKSRENSSGCHIYIVSRRPKISIDPATVVFEDQTASFNLRLQRQGDFDEIPVRVSTVALGGREFRWISTWPFEEYTILNEKNEPISKGIAALAATQFGMVQPSQIPLEVLYVGQAFGKKGERDAWKRLQRHETLQRIYSENPADQEIWLTLCDISDLQLFININPRIKSEVTEGQDREHAAKVTRRIESTGFEDKEAVAIAEAGLIRFFQPEYNDKFRENYPDPKHVHISTCYDLDLSTVTVELQGEHVQAAFFGPAQGAPSHTHFASYELRAADGLFNLWPSS